MISRPRIMHLVISALAVVAISVAWTAPIARAAAPQRTAAAPKKPATAGERSVWDGVGTDEQSQRGERIYTDTCVSCHSADLTGSQIVPALVGTDFLNKWNSMTAGDLFEQIRQTMPQDGPGTLTPAQYVDVLAYVLIKNKFPSGKSELAPEFDALKSIKIEPSKKP
jgi:mono/diheme cytochrome c family protein